MVGWLTHLLLCSAVVYHRLHHCLQQQSRAPLLLLHAHPPSSSAWCSSGGPPSSGCSQQAAASNSRAQHRQREAQSWTTCKAVIPLCSWPPRVQPVSLCPKFSTEKTLCTHDCPLRPATCSSSSTAPYYDPNSPCSPPLAEAHVLPFVATTQPAAPPGVQSGAGPAEASQRPPGAPPRQHTPAGTPHSTAKQDARCFVSAQRPSHEGHPV